MTTTLAPTDPRPPALPAGLPPRAPRRSFGVRLLGWTLLIASVGLVSCQSLFVL